MTQTPATGAIVTTLAAEVRVLMVGSRQVTLSVARQLDRVELSQIQPFGRVRLSDGEMVIGRSCRDGSLVLASFDLIQGVPYVDDDDLNPDVGSKLTVCAAAASRDEYISVKLGDRLIRLNEDAVERCTEHQRFGSERCKGWTAAGHEAHIQAVIDVWDAQVAMHRRASELPLIVLAGLR